MEQYTHRDIEILEGVEVIRRRPAMYIGPAANDDDDEARRSRFVESVVANLAAGTPSPMAIRLTAWAGEAVTVAFDGEPLSLAPSGTRADELPQPELYQQFMGLGMQGDLRSFAFAIANALSARLVVSTVHDGVRYRAAFGRGGLLSFLAKVPPDEVLGTNWLTFKPDADVVPGPMTFAEAQAVVERVWRSSPPVSVTAIDRTTLKPDWW